MLLLRWVKPSKKDCVRTVSQHALKVGRGNRIVFLKLFPPSKPKRKPPSLNFHVDIRNTVTSISASSPSLT